jgi:hypothetical protein
MADFREQRACIKFCFKLGKTATECYEMLKTAFGEQAMGRSQTFQWFSRFKAGRTSIDDDERSGRPVSSSTPETFPILRVIQRDIVKNGQTSSSKVSVILVGFYRNLNFLDRFSRKAQVLSLIKIRPLGAELFHADGRT